MRLFCVTLIFGFIGLGFFAQAQIPANLGLVGDRFRQLRSYRS